MTIVLAVLAVVAVCVAVVAVRFHHRRDAPVVDGFNRRALTRVVERHERERVGREE